MKKFIKLFTAICSLSVAACTVAAVGCNSGFEPEGDNWYKYSNCYRVIELESETPEHVEKYELMAETLPCTSGVAITGFAEKDFTFVEGTLFIDKAINIEGFRLIRKNLGLPDAEETDEPTVCAYTALYTFDKPYKFSGSTYLSNFTGLTDFTVLGLVSEADVYTFKYTDYDLNGNEVGEGELEAIICTKVPYMDKFKVYNG